MSRAGPYDCIVIGAGHNGLVCTAYLARAGRKVLLLETAGQVGGAAVSREFAPQCRVSAVAHLLHLLPAAMMRELELTRHGLQLAATQMASTALPAASAQPGTTPLLFSAGTTPAVHGAPALDQAAYPHYVARLRRLAAALLPLLQQVPPRLGTSSWADRRALLQAALRIRRLGRADMRELLRIAAMNIYDLLQEHFTSPQLQGALAFDAILGSNLGPRSPGSVLPLLFRLAAEQATDGTGLCQPRGGMGALTAALARAAQAAGAEIRTDSSVERILVEADRAVGVRLNSGECIAAGCVASSADPKRTFLQLLGAQHLDAGFVRRVQHLRTRGLTAKLHLALQGLPHFPAVSAQQLGGRLLLAPSMEYLERAFNHTKYGEVSAQTALEITLPSVNDPGLAPAGTHILSAIVQYVPYAVKQGWELARRPFIDSLIDLIAAHAPGIRAQIVGTELLTPADIERQFSITGGHWHHAELAFDQFLMVRPVPGAAQYATPVSGLYLCGAGAHPGGGVMGTAGRLSARQILQKEVR